MRVHCVESFEELRCLAEDWRRLTANSPFQSWEWITSWYATLGAHFKLCVLAVYDDAGRLIGAAPWCLQESFARGRMIRNLGTGKACSDYVGILCHASAREQVAQAIVSFLDEMPSQGGRGPLEWDLLELDGVDASDYAMQVLVAKLSQTGRVQMESGPNCWAVQLPATWEEYLQNLGKPSRRKIRTLWKRYVASGRAVWRLACTSDEQQEFLASLITLHTLRRNSLGCGGCFAYTGFDEFLRRASEQLFAADKLWLTQTELDGRVVANSIGLRTQNCVYLYQCGIHPAQTDVNPGWLQNAMSIQHAIENGMHTFDFLRGDEPYKKQLGGAAVDMRRLRVTSKRMLSRLRHGLWSTLDSAIHALPRGTSH